MAELLIQNISKHFENQGIRHDVFLGFSMHVQNGESVCLVGPNGCGKTTLLNLVAGFDQASDGQIQIGVNNRHTPRIGFVFQDYASSLFPWMTTKQNIAFALQCHGLDVSKADLWLERLGLGEHSDKFSYQLSGGQRQRLAIARALAVEPDLLLLDEPFSAVDFSTKLLLEQELRQLGESLGFTMVCVSHDVDQAIFLADRVVVLSAMPATVMGTVHVDLPGKRKASVRVSNRFLWLKRKVLNLYENATH